jgi:hypothetical protein
MEQRAVIKFSVKLKKTGTEMFEMLKCVYDEECLQVCLNGIKDSNKGSENENAKIVSENEVCCIFMLKVSFVMNLCQKADVNGKFYREVIKRLSSQFICVGPRVSGKWVQPSSA